MMCELTIKFANAKLKGGTNVIEEISQLGSIVKDEEDILSSHIKQVSPEIRGRKQYVLKFDFDLPSKQLVIDANEEMDENSAAKYVFVGPVGSRSPQWYVTSNKADYHLSETIHRLHSINVSNEINDILLEIIEEFYEVADENLDNKYKYILDINKAGFTDKTIGEIYADIEEGTNKGKELLNAVAKEFESYLNKKYGLDYNDIALYTILINGKPLSDLEEYREAVIQSKRPKVKKIKGEDGVVNDLVCSICLSKDNVSSDTTKMKIKYYTTNQFIFASGMDDKNYYKNMLLCGNCMGSIQAGENYIFDKLDTNIARFKVYIIPNFIYSSGITKEDMDRITKKITNSFSTVKNINAAEELSINIENILVLEGEDYYFLLNFVFYRPSQASTKILRLIKDVSPSIFKKIHYASQETHILAKNVIGENYNNNILLETVYYMTPVRLDRGKPTEYRNVLNIYDALFTERRLPKRTIIKNINDIFKIVYLEKPGYNVQTKKENLHYVILDAVFYIKFLEFMGCLKGEKVWR